MITSDDTLLRAILHEMLDLVESTEQNRNKIAGLHLLIDTGSKNDLDDMDFILSHGRRRTLDDY